MLVLDAYHAAQTSEASMNLDRRHTCIASEQVHVEAQNMSTQV